ncbi:MAG: cell division protein CrgA [Actinomycetota bacterium]
MARWKSTNRTPGRTAPINSKADDAEASVGRVTPRSAPRAEDIPSPSWLPIVMAVLFGIGMLTIIGNYIEIWPGSPTNNYLGVGLLFILGGTVLATRWR